MSNSWFQFKQFRIAQDRCAMKVTTDACILGAWVPVLPEVKRVLDIGAGTGLLSLMLAQRSSDAIIDAIELDGDAAAQAMENIDESPWKERINIIEGDVCGHHFANKYDLIISNPPFFNDSLLSDKAQKNMARHTGALSYAALTDVCVNNLNENGYIAILLPYTEYRVWDDIAIGAGLIPFGKLSVRHRPGAQVKRVVALYSKVDGMATIEEELVIQDADNSYTTLFRDLLGPYYLDL